MGITSINVKTKIENRSGFALVSTLFLLVLLTVVAVGMLSLSAVSLRTGSQGSAKREAQANARMALMIAIGELQKQMGPDQRISANAGILDKSGSFDVKQKHWMGSWDAWIAGTIPSDVNPKYPSAESHHQTLGSQADDSMRPAYANKNAHFRSWLVSLDPASAGDLSKVTGNFTASLTPGTADKTITLVGEGSLGAGAAADERITVPLVSQAHPGGGVSGRYGYWVGDENQKARIMHDSYSGGTLTSADKIYRRQAPGSTGTKVASGLKVITDETEIPRVVSLGSLKLLSGAAGNPYHKNFHAATIHSKGVLADVREGGLKRDLSTLLERPISTSETAPEFMLYEFDDPRFPSNRSNSRVPIQDLAAYYQLYDNDASWAKGRRGGVSYGSTGLPNSIQVTTPNYDGGNADRLKFQGEYAGLYKQPAIAKVQFLLAIGAQQITPADRAKVIERVSNPVGYYAQIKPMRDSDTHRLRLGIMPVVTLWNPNNLPMVMDHSQILRFCTPPFALQWRKYREGVAAPKDARFFNLNYAMGGCDASTGIAQWGRPHIITYRFAKNSRIIFEPGEVKMFSAPSSTGGTLKQLGNVSKIRDSLIDPVNSWDPNGLFVVQCSSPIGWSGSESPDVYDFNFTPPGRYDFIEEMVFGAKDRLTFRVMPEQTSYSDTFDGRRSSATTEVYGAGFNLSMTDEGYYGGINRVDFMRNFQMLSRHGHQPGWGIQPFELQHSVFNRALITPGFPGGSDVIDFKGLANAMKGEDIIGLSEKGEATGIMDFSLSYGCEAGSGSLGGFSSGRRVASRPFLHSGVNAAPLIDQADKASLYNYGWDWQLNVINNIEDSIVQGEPATGRGFFGGGYTVEAGTTHVVQREIPVLPPISIASLSHAHLGGYSLARNNTVGQNPATDNYAISIWDVTANARVRLPVGVDYQQVTATGQGGLAPHVVQAIGNSYAHPNIPADKAFVSKARQLDGTEPSVNAPFVDHSYLANKALWDNYFFSSIAPQLATPLNGNTARTYQQVATDFFNKNTPLPNRRLAPHGSGISSGTLTDLFAGYSLYNAGFADKIASHLMVEGSFNINSTSVEAWKILFSSLKGKPTVRLGTNTTTPVESTPANTVVGYGSLPAANPVTTASIDSPNSPPDQWKGGRELSDDEIDKLAVAMVEQVKLRGPFLSLSEFINRRLDGTKEEFALKGALQAALDHKDVPINAQFRENDRKLDNETASITFPFDAAANGPVAYGSAAYVDQADILRGLAEQLTPRGDTFVIRTYGDSVGKNGEVLARAWCEAVVQRVPEYLDPADKAHVKQSDLTSAANRKYGRKLVITGFRWLGKDEI